MNKKTDTHELDIPKDDIECWDRYPKHRWIYELSRLLDSQNIKWSLYETDTLTDKESNIKIFSIKDLNIQSGFIYTKKPEGNQVFTEVFITKGEVKLMRHVDLHRQEELTTLIGEIELRISAFITLYFQKFTGVIGIESISNEIFHVQLRPYLSLNSNTDQEVIKLVKRIYKRSITINGLTDRNLHESLAS